MAYAGTPTGLAHQPAASNRWFKPLLTAVVILAIGFALAMATSFVIGRQAGSAAIDRSFDQIEAQRGAWTASGVSAQTNAAIANAAAAKARAMSGVPADTSYTAVENLRAQSGVTVDTDAIAKAAAAKARAMSGVPVDTSYNQVEKARGAWSLSGVTIDTSYDAVEKARGAAMTPSQLDATSFDRKYSEFQARGQHGQLP